MVQRLAFWQLCLVENYSYYLFLWFKFCLSSFLDTKDQIQGLTHAGQVLELSSILRACDQHCVAEGLGSYHHPLGLLPLAQN